MKVNILRGALCAVMITGSMGSAFADDVHTVRELPGYQCMVLAKMWNGEGPQPSPVRVYAGPSANAAQAGVAGGTVIVSSPMKVVDGRADMKFADGREVWIGVDDIAPFHVVSNPHATCTPVLLSNDRYGFETRH
jgi:hypothetical protein